MVEAEKRLRVVLAGRRKALPPTSPDIAWALANLGEALIGQRRAKDAEPLLREALAIEQKALPEDSYEVGTASGLLGEALAGQKRFKDAEPLILRGANNLLASSRTTLF